MSPIRPDDDDYDDIDDWEEVGVVSTKAVVKPSPLSVPTPEPSALDALKKRARKGKFAEGLSVLVCS